MKEPRAESGEQRAGNLCRAAVFALRRVPLAAAEFDRISRMNISAASQCRTTLDSALAGRWIIESIV